MGFFEEEGVKINLLSTDTSVPYAAFLFSMTFILSRYLARPLALLELDQWAEPDRGLAGFALVGSGLSGGVLRRVHPDQYCIDRALLACAPDGGQGAPGIAARRCARVGGLRGVPVPAGRGGDVGIFLSSDVG